MRQEFWNVRLIATLIYNLTQLIFENEDKTFEVLFT